MEENTELVAPVVDHAEKIARMEEREAAREAELNRSLESLRNDLFTRVDETSNGTSERLSALEARIKALLTKPEPEQVEEQAEEVLAQAEEFNVPAEQAPKEQKRKGIRNRRRRK